MGRLRIVNNMSTHRDSFAKNVAGHDARYVNGVWTVLGTIARAASNVAL